jgi:hypothetical protein
MSGQKISYVQITDKEYNRFMASAREVESIESRVQYQLNRQAHQLKSNFDSQLNQIKYKTKRQEASIKKLDNKIDNLIESIEAKETNKKNQALAWFEEAKDALVAIESCRHNKFCPNEYAKLQQKLNLSSENIKNEVFESSVSGSQTLWQEACELNAKLGQLENEWNIHFEQAIESTTKLIATCDAQTTLKLAFDVEDGNEDLVVDIDYWCDGELATLKQQALMQEQLLNDCQDLKLEDFKRLIQHSSKLEDEVKNLTQKAKNAILLSQMRSDMASDIVEALDQSGFVVSDHCFAEDDERKSIHLKLLSKTGDEIVTIITPIENRKNKLDVHFFGDSDEKFKQIQLKNIFDRLSNAEVQCTAPLCAEGTQFKSNGDEKMRDFIGIKHQYGQMK